MSSGGILDLIGKIRTKEAKISVTGLDSWRKK